MSTVALVVSVVGLGVFVISQVRLQKSNTRLLDLRAFTHGMFTLSVLLMLVAQIALFGGAILLMSKPPAGSEPANSDDPRYD